MHMNIQLFMQFFKTEYSDYRVNWPNKLMQYFWVVHIMQHLVLDPNNICEVDFIVGDIYDFVCMEKNVLRFSCIT